MFYSSPHLTLAELQKWRSIPKIVLNAPNGYNHIYWCSSGALSLGAICLDISREKKRRLNIYLPGYFCGQSLRYLRTLPINLHFYALNESLLPNYSELNKSKNIEEIDILVHVHYFGQIAGQKKSSDFCNNYDAKLIEDCAHIMGPELSSKWEGDYLIFSPHKHFPLPPVALIISRNKCLSMKINKVDKFPLEWMLREALKKVIPFKKNVRWKRTWTQSEEVIELTRSNSKLEAITSDYLKNFLPYSIMRKNNAIDLINLLAGISDWSPLQEQSSLNCPYLVGMICSSPEIAERRFSMLNKNTQLVMQWPDLPIELRGDKHLLEQCTNWLDRTLFFFTHQQLNAYRMNKEISKITQKSEF